MALRKKNKRTQGSLLSNEDFLKLKSIIQSRKYLFHDIAADYGVNQGRISEINTGKRHTLRVMKKPLEQKYI